MRIILIWINLFSIIFAVNVGASISASIDQDGDGIYEDLLELSYNEVASSNNNAEEQLLSSSVSNIHANNEQAEGGSKIDGNQQQKQKTTKNRNKEVAVVEEEEKVHFALKRRQSTNPHQVEMEMPSDEKKKSMGRSSTGEKLGKRKSLPKRKKKKKKRRKERLQKNVKFIHDGVKSENFTISSKALSTAHAHVVDDLVDAVTTEKPATDEVVMEMVEAIIDNNNNNNENKKLPSSSSSSSSSTSYDDDKFESLRQRGESTKNAHQQQQQMSEMKDMKMEKEESSREFPRLGAPASIATESISSNMTTTNSNASNDRSRSSGFDANSMKIDKRLKRRRKFMIGDLSCMNSLKM